VKRWGCSFSFRHAGQAGSRFPSVHTVLLRLLPLQKPPRKVELDKVISFWKFLFPFLLRIVPLQSSSQEIELVREIIEWVRWRMTCCGSAVFEPYNWGSVECGEPSPCRTIAGSTPSFLSLRTHLSVSAFKVFGTIPVFCWYSQSYNHNPPSEAG
jgi:hypothetical protein